MLRSGDNTPHVHSWMSSYKWRGCQVSLCMCVHRPCWAQKDDSPHTIRLSRHIIGWVASQGRQKERQNSGGCRGGSITMEACFLLNVLQFEYAAYKDESWHDYFYVNYLYIFIIVIIFIRGGRRGIWSYTWNLEVRVEFRGTRGI